MRQKLNLSRSLSTCQCSWADGRTGYGLKEICRRTCRDVNWKPRSGKGIGHYRAGVTAKRESPTNLKGMVSAPNHNQHESNCSRPIVIPPLIGKITWSHSLNYAPFRKSPLAVNLIALLNRLYWKTSCCTFNIHVSLDTCATCRIRC